MPGHAWGRRASLALLGADERCGFAVAVRIDTTSAYPGRTAVEVRLLPRRTRLVDENEPVDSDVRVKGLRCRAFCRRPSAGRCDRPRGARRSCCAAAAAAARTSSTGRSAPTSSLCGGGAIAGGSAWAIARAVAIGLAPRRLGQRDDHVQLRVDRLSQCTPFVLGHLSIRFMCR